MDADDALRFARNLLVLLSLFAAIMIVVIAFDLTSYLATGREVLGQENATGSALIVYDPGVVGMAKRSAGWMAGDLRSRGYNVTIAGIRSQGVENASEYDVVVVIGPTRAGRPPGPVASYLSQVRTKENAIVGVLAIQGIFGDDAGPAMRQTLESHPIAVKKAGSMSAWAPDAEEQTYAFVYELLN